MNLRMFLVFNKKAEALSTYLKFISHRSLLTIPLICTSTAIASENCGDTILNY